ncbi:hypothetical protein EVAR_411_1 [Eumeta japonica]|uniref:Mos1 transposase HTH domain-containing protein n=1 Tax=Eumeta variegata TaxID=151549 RepID=A0A4C1SAA7_EUMVA|nr:hypothetical protein EVAR_411_1 [Eumeta japonica]
MSVRVTQNWFKRLESDNFDVEDVPRSGRPITDKFVVILEKVPKLGAARRQIARVACEGAPPAPAARDGHHSRPGRRSWVGTNSQGACTEDETHNICIKTDLECEGLPRGLLLGGIFSRTFVVCVSVHSKIRAACGVGPDVLSV